MSEQSPNEQYKQLVRESTAGKKSGRRKYGNEPIERDGIRYDSKAEYDYRGILDMQVRSHQIKGYDYHVMIPLLSQGGALVGHYEADFLVYLNDGNQEYHDVKSIATITDLFTWKARHVKAQYGVDIIRIDSKTLQPAK